VSKAEWLIQYIGFRARALVREYMFQVRRGSQDTIEFRLTILNSAFHSNLVRYQDAPDVCAQWIQQELGVGAAAAASPRTRWRMSDAELETYRSAHAPKPRRGLMYKPAVEPS
jgi:hypothetical protein